MTTQYIIDKQKFIAGAIEFFSILFPSVLEQEIGEIEIRTFKPPGQYFFSSKEELLNGLTICATKELMSISE